MRSVSLSRLVMAAILALAPVSVAIAAPSVDLTPSQASSLLKSHLPAGVTLGAGSPAEILAAFKAATAENPGTFDDIGGLIAVARPDLMDGLIEAVREGSPADAQEVINNIQDASANPTADELAAIASTDGAAPAAGPDADAGDGGSGN